jgi:spore coat protein U-like protein
LILIGIALLPALAHGQSCSVSTVGVNFGGYSTLSASNVSSTGTITINCNRKISTVLSIGASPNSGGFQPRQMKMASGSDLLSYNLYTTSAQTTIWGDGTSGTSTVPLSVYRSTPKDAIIYGLLPASQDVYVGSYSESLVVTVDF